MTVQSTDRRAGPYTGNGVVTAFPFAFSIFAKTDVQVVVADLLGAERTLVLDSDYSVTVNADQVNNPGGTVTLSAALANAYTLAIVGGLDYDQQTRLPNGGSYNATVVERTFDRLVMQIQQLREQMGRVFQGAVTSATALIFPAASAGKFLRWRGDGLGLENADQSDNPGLQGLLVAGSGSSLVGWIRLATGALFRLVYDKLAERVTITDWCVGAPSGTAVGSIPDETAGLQKALAYCEANNAVLRIPAGRSFKFSQPLSAQLRGGIDMDAVGSDATTGSALIYTGTGTALTITGSPCRLNYCLSGVGQTAGGTLLQSVILAKIGMVRVTDFVGFGVKVNRMWDCAVQSFSVERCGSTAEYAFSMNDDGDTCNMTHIGRLQVEHASSKGIFVSPNSLCVVIDSIHSESLSSNGAYIAWSLGGNRSTYKNVRLQAVGTPSDAKVLLNGSHNTYINLLTEGLIPVNADASNTSTHTLISPEIQGSLSEVTNQTGIINVVGGVVAALTGQTVNINVVGSKVAGVLQWARHKWVSFVLGMGLTYSERLTLAPATNAPLQIRTDGGLIWVRDVDSGTAAVARMSDNPASSAIINGDSAWTIGAAPAALGIYQSGRVLSIYNATGQTRTIDVSFMGNS